MHIWNLCLNYGSKGFCLREGWMKTGFGGFFCGWTPKAAEDTGRSGNVKTKTTSREGMLVSCWANPSWKKGENVESKGKREETIRWQRKVPGFGQRWKKGLLERRKKKILFPFTSSSLTFTCFLSMDLGRSPFFTPVVRLLSVQFTEAFGVNETAVLFERWSLKREQVKPFFSFFF